MEKYKLTYPKDSNITVVDHPMCDAVVKCINCCYGHMTVIEEALDEKALDKLCNDRSYRRGTLDRKWATKMHSCRLSRSVIVCLRDNNDSESVVVHTTRSSCEHAVAPEDLEDFETLAMSNEDREAIRTVKNARIISDRIISED